MVETLIGIVNLEEQRVNGSKELTDGESEGGELKSAPH